MKISIRSIISLGILLIHNRETDSINLSPDFLFGSIRNATMDATNFLSDSLRRQTDIIVQAKNTAADYVSSAVQVPRNMLIQAKNATRDYIDSTASKGMELKFRSIAEVFRAEMSYGIPSLDFPILEPMKIDHMDFDLDDKEIGNISSSLDNTTISGLSSFRLNDVKISLHEGLNVAINLSIPRIWTEGFYRIDGMVGAIFPVAGKGPFQLEIKGAKCRLETRLGYSGTMYVKNLTLDFSIESMNGRFYNLFREPETDEMMSKVISDAGPELLETMKPLVIPEIEELVARKINASMAGLTMANTVGILTGTIHLQEFGRLGGKKLISLG